MTGLGRAGVSPGGWDGLLRLLPSSRRAPPALAVFQLAYPVPGVNGSPVPPPPGGTGVPLSLPGKAAAGKLEERHGEARGLPSGHRCKWGVREQLETTVCGFTIAQFWQSGSRIGEKKALTQLFLP